MSERDRALAPREREPSFETTVSASALAKLCAGCPACGEPRSGDGPCARCGHAMDAKRWRRDRARERTMFEHLFSSAAGDDVLVAAFLMMLAIATIYIARGALAPLRWVGIGVAALLAPVLMSALVGFALRAAKRRWRYEASDGTLCLARGTPWAVREVVRVWLGPGEESRAPVELRALHVGHGRALLAVPEIASALPARAGASLETGRAVGEAFVAAAIAFAAMEREGSVRLVRRTRTTTRESASGVTREQRADFAAIALAPTAGEALSRWLWSAIDRDSVGEPTGYREATPDARTALNRMDAIVRSLLERERLAARGGLVDLCAAIRRQVNEGGDWDAEAPSLTIEARRWLAELAASEWLAAQRVEVGDEEAP